MSDYFQQSMKALQLAGMSESTQKSYTRSVRQVVEFHGRPPDEISEEDLEEYFLFRQIESGWSPATLRICYSGIKFFFVNVLQRDWHLFSYLKAPRERSLPAILSREEVYCLLEHVTTFQNYTYLAFVYACGLRLSEALHLEVSDIDSARGMIHVHRGKGAKDRYLPLPEDTLPLLRRYWRTHRNPALLFPALGRGGNQGPTATQPMAIGTVQDAFAKAKTAAAIHKRGVSIRTLRHCYATHLLEAGVNPRLIQRWMGHAQLETTMMYFHFTQKGTEDGCRILNEQMQGFDYADDR
jgi:integrase